MTTKLAVEIVDIDAFLDLRWSNVDELSNKREIRDFLQSPTFSVHEGLVVHIGKKYSYIYHKGKFRSLSHYALKRCDFAIEEQRSSWIETWRLCQSANAMAEAIMGGLPHSRLIQIAACVIKTMVESKGLLLEGVYLNAYKDILGNVTHSGPVPCAVNHNTTSTMENAIASGITIHKNHNYFMYTMQCFKNNDQATVASIIRQVIPMREIIGMLFQ